MRVEKTEQKYNINNKSEIRNSKKLTNSRRKIKSISTDSVVEIGRRIQAEFLSSLSPTNYNPLSTKGNWKSALILRAGLLLSNYPIRDFSTNKVRVYKDAILYGNNGNFRYPQSILNNNEHTITAHNQLDKMVKEDSMAILGVRKKRGLDDIIDYAQSDRDSTSKIYDTTSDNIENKINWSIETRNKVSPMLIDSLKSSIDKYHELSEKNSRNGIDLLKSQSNILGEIYKILQINKCDKTVLDNISDIIKKTQREYMSHKVNIENNIHVIWVAGAPPDSITKYATAYKLAYPGFVFNLWVDTRSMGAYLFNKTLQKIAIENAKSELIESLDQKELSDIQNNRPISKTLQDKVTHALEYNILKSQIKIQDAIMNYAYVKGVLDFSDDDRVDFLKNILNQDEKEIEIFRNHIRRNVEKTEKIKEKLITIFGEKNIAIHDVNSLPDMKIVHRKLHYQQELNLRWNYASATDQLRIYILKEYGGIYTDYDVAPGYTNIVYNILEQNSNNFDFLEKEECRRAFNDELLSIVSHEKSDGYKNKLNDDEKSRLDKITNEIKKIDVNNLFSPIKTSVIRDSMLMSKRYQWWGEEKGWNIRGNNNFLATHKDSKVTEFVISGQDNAYRQLFDIREKIRTESINVQYHYNNHRNTKKNLRPFQSNKENSMDGKVHFDHKKYGIGSLFSKYRMDGIIPRVYSTLHITGPDAIMKSMREYYNSLGELGKCRLDFSNNHFKGLSSDSFIGNLKRIEDVEGEHYDWKHQENSGVNDITPDDASSWTAKTIDVKSFLSDIVHRDQIDSTFRITSTKIDLKRLTVGWPSELKSKLRVLWPNLETEYNTLLHSNSINLYSLSNIDKKIHQYFLLSNNKLVKWTGISLTGQLSDHLNKLSIPIGNKVHYLLTDIGEQADEYKKSMFSILTSDSNSKLVIWKNDKYNKYLVVKELSILQERKIKIEELMQECEPQQREKLKRYHKLKRKEQLGIITSSEQESLLEIITYLSEYQAIKQKIIDIENSAYSIEIDSKRVENLDNIQDVKNLKGTGDYRDINILWNKYVSNERRTLDYIMSSALSRDLHNRIEIKDVSSDLTHTSLTNKLVHDGYGFDDLKQVMMYNILHKESGIIFQKAAVAAPSGELVGVINKHTSNNDADTSAILRGLYQHFFGDKPVDFGSSPEEQRVKSYFDLVLNSLDSDNLGKYFLSPLAQNVSPFGVKFSCDNGILTSDIIASGIRSIASDQKNVVLDKMNNYLSELYEIKKDINIHNRIDIELIKARFHKSSLIFMLKDDINTNLVLEKINQGSDISLTELSQLLTGNKNFIECSNVITFGDYPSLTNDIVKDIKSNLPSIYTMSDFTGLGPKNLKGIGYIGNMDYILTPPPSKRLHNASVQAKYRTLNWGDFYGRNARIWQETVTKYSGDNVKYHPQMLLTPEEGRCIGLSELYLLTDNVNGFQTLQKNIDLASSLHQKYLLYSSYLSEKDKKILDSVLSQIQYAQTHGNDVLLQSPEVDSIRLSDFNTSDIIKYLLEKNTKNILVTTEYHSMVILHINDRYRVVDPNFGYADFSTLDNALGFIEQSIQITPEVHELYTGDLFNKNIDIFTPKGGDWNGIVSTDLFLLTQREYESTQEMLTRNNINISIGGQSFEILSLYKYGVLFKGNRVDERIQKLTSEELDNHSFHLDFRILSDYINNNHLTDSDIKTIKKLNGILGYDEKSIEDLFKHGGVLDEGLDALYRHNENLLRVVHNTYEALNNKIKNYISSGFKLDRIMQMDNNAVTVLLNKHNISKHINIDVSEIRIALKEGIDALSDAIENMNLDGIMSILGIIQYSRLVYSGEHISPLEQAGFISDTKTVLEKIIGITLLSVGRSKFGSNISSINLESIAAQKISELAVNIGGSTGKILSRLSSIVKFPILDTTLNFWALGESIKTYTSIKEDSLEKKLAKIDLIFSSVSAALTLSSFAFPPLGFATFPLIFLQQDVRNFEASLYQDKVKRDAWKEVEKYLDESAQKIVSFDAKNGIIDLSLCSIIGDLVIDLSVSPPEISGKQSYNHGKDIGSVPYLSDDEVRKKSKYAISCTDSSDLNINNMFGSIRSQFCSDLSSFTNLVKGFANRVWPKEMPVIQRGNYKTVILGYSSQIKANTEVVRSTWGDFQEVAREGEPLVEKLYKNSRVITGNTPVSVVIPKLSAQEFSSRDILFLKELSEYSFAIDGGSGGVIIYSNGVGNFNIKCQRGAKNILSFRDLTQRNDAIINIKLDLNKKDKQSVVSYKWLIPPFANDTMMKLTQENIDTIISSDVGRNVFIGNSDGNHFIVGNAPTKIYLGEGGNVITIDKIKKGRVYIDVYAERAKTSQYLIIGCGINQLFHVSKRPDKLHLHFDKEFNKIITIHHSAKQLEINSQPLFYISTEDGLESYINKMGHVVVNKVDVLKYLKYYDYKGLFEPDEFPLNNKNIKLGETSFLYENYMVEVNGDNLIYKVFNSIKNIYVSVNKASTIYGCKSGVYYFWGVEQPNHNIFIFNDNNNPETINISNFTSTDAEVKIISQCVGNMCKLSVRDNNYTFTIYIRTLSGVNGVLKESSAKIILDFGKTITVRDIFSLSANTENQIIIYNNKWEK
ncbi:TcdA/TcdB catalytic glycosyltransferase domain-containing protein (plasmid) [Escherichia albertii]|uniref:TcdA/TcdB catalytic glycosyltransferase domain-containing protein n=1 Tax=Escherichia albertii TaxID=208962 RepID=UPI00235DE6AE|nr:TcdA/TcdB catalytic glycosyltransferase domain-containing protein [Escherichia albertii]WDC04425.1 TcdA/TcdB catalytic glycosyltransferase domain-containing protein [Escherichia albertii]